MLFVGLPPSAKFSMITSDHLTHDVLYRRPAHSESEPLRPNKEDLTIQAWLGKALKGWVGSIAELKNQLNAVPEPVDSPTINAEP